MSHPAGASGPQFRADRPVEHEAVRTTIVGGRPPGSGQPVGPIPRGIEVLVKKAAVDSAFCETLLRDRAAAATAIGLALDPAEAMMLAAVPAAQLEAIIAQINVPQEQRRTFLGHAAAAMVAIVAGTAVTTGCRQEIKKGIAPDKPRRTQSTAPAGDSRVPVDPAVADRVIEIIAKVLDIDKSKVSAASRFAEDLYTEPLDSVQVVMELEEEFKITISDEEAAKVRTVGQAIELVARLSAAKEGKQP